jgi:hypothetical protein
MPGLQTISTSGTNAETSLPSEQLMALSPSHHMGN